MKFRKTQDPFRTILKIVIGVVFSVALLVMVYKAATTSSENRSKAAETQITYKSWEFNGTTTEGWLLTNLTGTRIAGGLLTAKITGNPSNPATLVNKSGGSVLRQGNKYIKLRIAIASSPRGSAIPIPEKPINTKFPAPTTTAPFTISASYISKGATRTTPQIRGVADGKFYVYSVILPDIGAVTIDSVQLALGSVKTGTPVQLDYVRLVGSPPSTPTPASCSPNGSACTITVCPTMPPCPAGTVCTQMIPPCTAQKGICSNNRCVPYATPSPTIVCKTGVNSFSVDTPCTGGFQYMTFACYDGLSRREGGPTSCKSSSVWSSYAQEYCKSRSNCPISTTPTGGPIPATPLPAPPTPTPVCVTFCETNGICKTTCYQPIPTGPTATSMPPPPVPVFATWTPTPASQ